MSDKTTDYLEADLAEAKAEIKRLKSDLTAAAERIAKARASTEVAIAALAAGANPAALPDLQGRIEAAGWTIAAGQAVMPGSPIGPDEWIAGLKVTARHFFGQEPSPYAPLGTTAQPTGGGQGLPVGRANPWSRDGWDDMAQAAAYRADPAKAEAMATAAGSRIGALKPS